MDLGHPGFIDLGLCLWLARHRLMAGDVGRALGAVDPVCKAGHDWEGHGVDFALPSCGLPEIV